MPQLRTKALFWETSTDREKDKPKFTLKLEDHTVDGVVYKSAYQIFLNASTEYEAGSQIAGSWNMWEKLSQVEWFKTGRKGNANSAQHIGLEEWRRHKRIKDIDEQITNLKKKAEAGDVAASKAVIAHLKEQEKEIQKAKQKPKPRQTSASNMVADFMREKEQREAGIK